MSQDLEQDVEQDILQPSTVEVEAAPALKKRGGWAEDGSKKKRRGAEDSLLLEAGNAEGFGAAVDDIPVIPDIEELQEEQLLSKVSAPPSVAVHRVATYKQLDSDLHKHSGLYLLDGEVDLKMLAKFISPEEDIKEEDKPWHWDHLLTELQSDLQEHVQDM